MTIPILRGPLGPLPPDILAGLVIWLDAAYGTDTTTNAAAVGSWAVKAGSAAAFTGAGGTRPTYVTSAINGLPGVKAVSASSQRLLSTSTLGGLGLGTTDAIWIVATVPSVPTDSTTSYQNAMLFGDRFSDANPGGYRGVYLRSSLQARSYVFDHAGDQHADATFALNTPTIFRARHVSGTLYLKINAGVEASAAGDPAFVTTNVLGLFGGTQSFYCDATICEVVVSNAAESAGALSALDSYLGTKYGIAV